MSIEESLLSKPLELRIVLVGKVQAGKTSVMNTLLTSSEDNEKPASGCPPVTEKCEKKEAKIGGQNVVIVDTPGLCSAEKTDEEVMEEIKRCVLLAPPGPHVFLLVFSCLEKYTKEEQDMVEFFTKHIFGRNHGEHIPYMMTLFTNGDELKANGKTIQEFIEENSDLKSFVDKCNDGYHVIDNRDQSSSQVIRLLQQINSKVHNNGGKYYGDENFKQAEKEVQAAGAVRKIALSVNGCALAGAGLGAGVSHVVGSPVGIIAGMAAGAAVGGVVGCVGVVVAEHIKVFFGRRGRRQAVGKSSANI